VIVGLGQDPGIAFIPPCRVIVGTTRIVIAEDSRIQARMLQKRLESAGFEVRHGADGLLALELIRRDPPDLIISDIEMPNMNGYQLCREVKQDPQLRRIPLILLSTLSDPQDIIAGLQAGADNYVTKPYETDYLLARIEALLQTPIAEAEFEQDTEALEVILQGKRFAVQSGRQQVLNLLISTFEGAVEKNVELIRANQELSMSRDKLARQHAMLQELNDQLEANNARMTRDLAAAARVQHSLLPGGDVAVQNVEVAWRYIPCDELAGDFLSFFMLDDRHLALYIVDVSGHGVSSSLLSVTVARSLTRQVTTSSILARQSEDGSIGLTAPADVANELNRRFPMEDQGNLYFTMFYGILNTLTGDLRYVSAGHPPAVLLPVDGGQPQMLPAEGFAIGWMEEIDAAEETIALNTGDRLFIFSDGVPEAMNEDLEEFGDARMLELISQTRGMTIDAAVAKIKTGIDEWCRVHGPKDDVSILAVELLDPGAGSPSLDRAGG
jgi:sigma-B regulation protein RsbU (phosphoserine phosphatase)